MEKESFFTQADETDFDEAYALIESAFPKIERRPYEEQKALLKLPEYTLYLKRSDKGHIVALLGVWHYDDFDFIEHAAVIEQARGGGIGSRIFLEYMEEHPTTIFLEVEYPNEENARRRIRFYKRLGFHMNPYEYAQPAFYEGEEDLPLYVMTWPETLDNQTFEQYRDVLMRTVYNKAYCCV